MKAVVTLALLLVLLVVLATLLLIGALWLPFYIGSVLLPDNWLEGLPYWWSLPMVLTLFALSMGCAFGGGLLFIEIIPEVKIAGWRAWRKSHRK